MFDAMCAPAVGRLAAMVLRDRIPNFGCRIDTRWPGVDPRVKAGILWTLYEGTEVRFIRRHLRADLDVLELGGGIGLTGSHVLRRMGRGRRLVCVEANPDVLPCLTANLTAHAGGASFTVVHAAVVAAGHEGSATLLQEGAHRSRLLGPDEPVPGGRSVAVPAVTLSALLDAHDLEEYALVSDVEGAEAAFLTAESEALRGCRQIIVELHDAPAFGPHARVDLLLKALVDDHGFRRRDGYGNVFVLDREARRPERAREDSNL